MAARQPPERRRSNGQPSFETTLTLSVNHQAGGSTITKAPGLKLPKRKLRKNRALEPGSRFQGSVAERESRGLQPEAQLQLL